MAPEKYDKISMAIVTAVVVMAALAAIFVVGILPTNPGTPPPSVAPPPLAAPAEHQPPLEGDESTDEGGEHESEGGEHSP